MKTIKKWITFIATDCIALFLLYADLFKNNLFAHNVIMFIFWFFSIIRLIIILAPEESFSNEQIKSLKLDMTKGLSIYNTTTNWMFIFILFGIGWITTGILFCCSSLFFELKRKTLLKKLESNSL